MDDVEIERACQRLVTEYGHLADHGRASEIPDLFTDDGVNNFLCTVESTDEASSVTYLTLYRFDGEPGRALSPLDGPFLVGEYRDRFRRTTDGWRFAARHLQPSFVKE